MAGWLRRRDSAANARRSLTSNATRSSATTSRLKAGVTIFFATISLNMALSKSTPTSRMFEIPDDGNTALELHPELFAARARPKTRREKDSDEVAGLEDEDGRNRN